MVGLVLPGYVKVQFSILMTALLADLTPSRCREAELDRLLLLLVHFEILLHLCILLDQGVKVAVKDAELQALDLCNVGAARIECFLGLACEDHRLGALLDVALDPCNVHNIQMICWTLEQ